MYFYLCAMLDCHTSEHCYIALQFWLLLFSINSPNISTPQWGIVDLLITSHLVHLPFCTSMGNFLWHHLRIEKYMSLFFGNKIGLPIFWSRSPFVSIPPNLIEPNSQWWVWFTICGFDSQFGFGSQYCGSSSQNVNPVYICCYLVV